jgi:hypothetical protein
MKACKAVIALTDATRQRPNNIGRIVVAFLSGVILFSIAKFVSPPEWLPLFEAAEKVIRGLALVVVSMVLMTKGSEHSEFGLKTAEALLRKVDCLLLLHHKHLFSEGIVLVAEILTHLRLSI